MLASYLNGNCTVTIAEDGTKTRTWEGEAKPEFPESIDLKITNYCDHGCAWCHESSYKFGAFGSLRNLYPIIKGIKPGMEIAIGGGNPLTHPELTNILAEIKNKDAIANITVNEVHVPTYAREIRHMQDSNLIKGVGVSIDDDTFVEQNFAMINNGNVIAHVIAGKSDIWAIRQLIMEGLPKILVLGYKTFGRGVKVADQYVKNLAYWKYHANLLLTTNATVAFDNLAIEQLNIKGRITQAAWASSYMGDDGTFSMYIDAVKNEYAKSSISPRKPIGKLSITEMFADVRSSL